jgi:hypothetical protein
MPFFHWWWFTFVFGAQDVIKFHARFEGSVTPCLSQNFPKFFRKARNIWDAGKRMFFLSFIIVTGIEGQHRKKIEWNVFDAIPFRGVGIGRERQSGGGRGW